MSDELLPCPWCGTPAAIHQSGSADHVLIGCLIDDPDVCEFGPYQAVEKSRLAEAIEAWNHRAAPVFDSVSLMIVLKALQRYRTRTEEIGALGWYENPEVTRQEIARVDAILALLEPTHEHEVSETKP